VYLKSIKIINFRKFGTKNNVVDFVSRKKPTPENPIDTLATATTLLVGKNNAGKTTITKALDKIVSSSNEVKGNEFNFTYLVNLLSEYKKGNIEVPLLAFSVIINITSADQDSMANLPFLSLEDTDKKDFDLSITVKYEIKEYETFKDDVKKIISKYKSDLLFKKFLELIDNTDFAANYYDLSGGAIDSNKFKLSSLIKIKLISANKNLHDTNLSTTFNKIIKYRYELENGEKDFELLDSEINRINDNVTKQITETHHDSINEILHTIEANDRLSIKLSSDLTFNKLMNSLIRYEYTEGDLLIPEGQFGLGYANLMYIIGELIDYVERYQKEDIQSSINLICIEEPETYMHPQMQESFIKYIDDAILALLKNTKKKINSQLIITTHSSHILNSKIHTSNSFDNINYVTNIENHSSVIKLNDQMVRSNEEYVESPDETEKEFYIRKTNDLKFLKKHIKYKVSELFFSDAVIFVEGDTEATLLPYYIEKDKELKKHYISVFNISGAHGQVYHPLIKLLKIPSLIITDLDIKRTPEEKYEYKSDEDGTKIKIEKYTQIDSIKTRISTNTTIHKFNGIQSIGLSEYCKDDNLYAVFQKDSIENYYATSFEEAFILQNYKNTTLHEALKKTKPNIFKEIVGDDDFDQLKENSYKLQKKLSNDKSDFANNLLYELIINEEQYTDNKDLLPSLPKYITDGFDWLKVKTKESMKLGTKS